MTAAKLGPIVVDAAELQLIAAAVRANFIHSDIIAQRLERMLVLGLADNLLGDAIAELRRLPCRKKDCEHCRIIREFSTRSGQ